ncbi:MAG: winged helix-turn-helix domain-containing protein [Chloroflexi bacterium]|nr:winged helix-turn-helix domain-containing protein [Chloroflexota bacterium]
MSIRLDPRRVNALKHLAGEAGVRPGDLVRQWVEERIDASRPGADAAPGPDSPAGPGLAARIEALEARIDALESGGSQRKPKKGAAASADADAGGSAAAEPAAGEDAPVDGEPAETAAPKRARKRASAAPTKERVALHDEMIEVLRERGPMRAADLAEAIVERGRYEVPRSGKPLDGKTVSQRVSNPTYRSRFVRNEGLIGLAEG